LFLFTLAVIATGISTIIIGAAYSSNQLPYTNSYGQTRSLGNEESQFPLISRFFALMGFICVIFLVLVGYRATSPKIPDGYGIRTVADTLRLMCSSRCVSDFAQVSMLAERERYKAVLGWEKKYTFGVVRGEDGVKRWGVDFVEYILPDKTLDDHTK
jgi:hypothetical protein